MSFQKGCENCGKQVEIDVQICPKCKFDFTLHPRISPKCPYCEEELHIYDFYKIKLDKNGRKLYRGFIGESFGFYKEMHHCPFCGKILGFSNMNRN